MRGPTGPASVGTTSAKTPLRNQRVSPEGENRWVFRYSPVTTPVALTTKRVLYTPRPTRSGRDPATTTLSRAASDRISWRTSGVVRESGRRRSSANPVLHISGSTQRRAPRAAASSMRRPARSRFEGTSATSTRNCNAAARNGETGIGTPCSASGSGDGARDRHDHYRVRAGAFQGAGARFRRGAGGVHVVEQKDRRRDLAASRHAESPLDVFVPEDSGKACLGTPLSGSRKRQRIERETGVSRKTGGDQRGEVEPPPEIFPGVGRYRDHGRRCPVRDQVPPSPREGFAEAQGHRVDRVGAGRVFRRYDRGADVPRVGE